MEIYIVELGCSHIFDCVKYKLATTRIVLNNRENDRLINSPFTIKAKYQGTFNGRAFAMKYTRIIKAAINITKENSAMRTLYSDTGTFLMRLSEG